MEKEHKEKAQSKYFRGDVWYNNTVATRTECVLLAQRGLKADCADKSAPIDRNSKAYKDEYKRQAAIFSAELKARRAAKAAKKRSR